jgi:hypothetical protein
MKRKRFRRGIDDGIFMPQSLPTSDAPINLATPSELPRFYRRAPISHQLQCSRTTVDPALASNAVARLDLFTAIRRRCQAAGAGRILPRTPDARKTPAATRITPMSLRGVTVSSRKATPPSKARIGVSAPKAAVSAAPRRRTA